MRAKLTDYITPDTEFDLTRKSVFVVKETNRGLRYSPNDKEEK